MKSPEILNRLVRRFGLLLLLTLIGGSAGVVYGAVKTPTYLAKAYVVAVGQPGESTAALNFAQAYGRIATSGQVLTRAAGLLGADKGGLTRVTASTSPDAPVIQVTATGTDARHAAELANAVSNALVGFGNTRMAETRVNLAVLAAATPPAKSTSPKPPLELAVGATGGLLIGGLAVLAGVGRSSSAQQSPRADTESGPAAAKIQAVRAEEEADAEVSEPVTRPTRTGRYLGVARVPPGPKSIAAHRPSPPIYLMSGLDEIGTTRRVPSQRIVGRVAVSAMEDQ